MANIIDLLYEYAEERGIFTETSELDGSLDEALEYVTENGISNTTLPESVMTFIDRFNKEEEMCSAEFDIFFATLLGIKSEEIKRCIAHTLSGIAYSIYLSHKSEIDTAVKSIEEALKQSDPTSQSAPNNKLNSLLNIYRLFQNSVLGNYVNGYPSYPEVRQSIYTTLCFELPLSINALLLTGRLRKDNAVGIDLTNHLYPNKFPLGFLSKNRENLLLRKGVKDASNYVPFKLVSKLISLGDDVPTFLATDNRKLLFIRGLRYSPTSILASKIATLVSPAHFSSERLLSNRLVGSRKLDEYAISVVDERILAQKIIFFDSQNSVFPGTGIVDEVTNYVAERDQNRENFGFSSIDISNSHVSKIDFDGCMFRPLDKKDYEFDILTKTSTGIYSEASCVSQNVTYIREKLITRIKLSMLTQDILSALADKAFTVEDGDYKEDVAECVRRSDIAFDLFLEHAASENLCHENPELLNQCFAEIKVYILSHFEEHLCESLICSLEDRVRFMRDNIQRVLPVSLSAFAGTVVIPPVPATNSLVQNMIQHSLIYGTSPTTISSVGSSSNAGLQGNKP